MPPTYETMHYCKGVGADFKVCVGVDSRIGDRAAFKLDVGVDSRIGDRGV